VGREGGHGGGVAEGGVGFVMRWAGGTTVDWFVRGRWSGEKSAGPVVLVMAGWVLRSRCQGLNRAS